jgi:hypothetical protein
MSMMTLEQALAFKIDGKPIRDMTVDDWRRWLRRIRGERMMLATMSEADVTDEQDQSFHASADRLGDTLTALQIIFADD